MKLLIETCLTELFLVLFDKNNKVVAHFKEPIQKKGDVLPKEYEKLLQKAQIKTKDLRAIYVTNGPGSFTGSRVGLVFAKTIAQVLNIDLFTLDTLSFLSRGEDGYYYIDARSNLSYEGKMENGKMSIKLVKYQKDSIADYENILSNLQKHLALFKKVKNIAEEKVLYVKDPKIGG